MLLVLLLSLVVRSSVVYIYNICIILYTLLITIYLAAVGTYYILFTFAVVVVVSVCARVCVYTTATIKNNPNEVHIIHLVLYDDRDSHVKFYHAFSVCIYVLWDEIYT